MVYTSSDDPGCACLRYPRIFEGLMGWTIQSIACGAQHFAVSASYEKEHSTITWCACSTVQWPMPPCFLAKLVNVKQWTTVRLGASQLRCGY